MDLVESLFAQLLFRVLHPQKQKDGWPSAVALAKVAKEKEKNPYINKVYLKLNI